MGKSHRRSITINLFSGNKITYDGQSSKSETATIVLLVVVALAVFHYSPELFAWIAVLALRALFKD